MIINGKEIERVFLLNDEQKEIVGYIEVDNISLYEGYKACNADGKELHRVLPGHKVIERDYEASDFQQLDKEMLEIYRLTKRYLKNRGILNEG